MQDLGVSAGGEVEIGVEPGHLLGRERLGQMAEKVDPLVRGPVRGLDRRAALEVADLLLHFLERVGLDRRRVRGDARPVDPWLGVDVRERGAELGHELARGHRVEGVAVEVVAQEFVPRRAADCLLDQAQQEVAFLVGELGRGFVGIAAGEVEQQVRVAAVLAQLAHDLLEVLPAQQREHLGVVAAVDRLHDAALEVDGEAFVEPEVVPRRVGDEVARPGVGQLVRHEVHQRAVAGQDGRRGEGEARVLHPAEREAGRQHQDVVLPPAIRPVNFLRRVDHLLRVGQLPRRGVDYRLLRVDKKAGRAA